MIFKASYGTSTKVSTAVVVFIFVTIASVDYYVDGSMRFPLLMLGGMVLLIAVCYAFSVKYYEVTDQELIIHKRFGETAIKKANIKNVALLDRKTLRFAIRTFGIGGVFGYYGEFYTSKLGSMTWYRTKLDNPVIIGTSTKKIVLSPDEPEKFMAAVQS